MCLTRSLQRDYRCTWHLLLKLIIVIVACNDILTRPLQCLLCHLTLIIFCAGMKPPTDAVSYTRVTDALLVVRWCHVGIPVRLLGRRTRCCLAKSCTDSEWSHVELHVTMKAAVIKSIAHSHPIGLASMLQLSSRQTRACRRVVLSTHQSSV